MSLSKSISHMERIVRREAYSVLSFSLRMTGEN